MQEPRVESADRVSVNQAYGFIRMELNQANPSDHHSRREGDWLQTELEDRERALQETRIGTLQEMEELKKLCCAEAERAQHLTIDDLFSTRKVNQQRISFRFKFRNCKIN